MLSNGLKLFVADVIDEDTGIQKNWYVVEKTYNLAFEKFMKRAESFFYSFAYYFEEANNDEMEDFIDRYKNIKVGIYDV